jgi:multisubunit Na+/H+ antiporter MnhB subunit
MMAAQLWQALDLLLAGLTLGLGWAAVSSPDLKRSVVFFIAFGLLLAVVWARLQAPDLALAEAAIGAGLSGALLLSALRDEPDSALVGDVRVGPVATLISLASLALAAGFAWVTVRTLGAADPVRLAEQITSQLPNSGVSNPVTAVLLNFRAYDTLLELAVLLAAVLGILALGPARAPYRAAGPMLDGLIRWLAPLLILTAGYLLWVGAHAPGGAFQAGAILAAAAVMLRLGGHAGAGLPQAPMQRILLTAGIAAFLLVGITTTGLGLAFLQYPEGWSGGLILLIETAATLAIATTLALAYIGGRPTGWGPEGSPITAPQSGARD